MDEPLSNLDAKLRVQMRAEIARLQNRLGTTTVYVTHDQTEAMTLADRVVVLRAGEAQQIGTPDELYNAPANLFVAGFIGSPSMNFFPATPTENGLRLPFGAVTLQTIDSRALPERIIVGARPEHFEDASLLEPHERGRSLTFGVTADLVESLGSDKYVYFSTGGAGVHSEHLSDAESGAGGNRYVARVSADSNAATGQTVELALDTSRLAVFDADTGVNLTAPRQ
jgi:multiple sugar transport system ATP-binding protein